MVSSIVTFKGFPLIAAAVAATLALVLRVEFPEQGKVIILSSSVTFSSITCAFGGMSISVLTGLDTPLMRKMRSARSAIEELRRILGGVFFAGLILSVASIGLMFVEWALSAVVWTALAMLCVAMLSRMAVIMLLVFGDSENQIATDAKGTISV